MAASKFPKIRETRAPKVSELRSVAEQLDPKYQFLSVLPDTDPDGNPTVVKFSRKNQEQYVGSETAEGKQTKWSLVFQNGKWVEA